ncbi:MAG: S8 family serine peptidase [Sphaerospermopsis kisseleviana]
MIIITPMKRLFLTLLIGVGLIGSSYAADLVPGRVLVKPADGADEAAVQGSLKAAGAREIGRVPQIGVRILQVPAQAEARVIAALSNNPNIEFAEPDYIANIILTPNDPYYSAYQWHLPKVSAPRHAPYSAGGNNSSTAIGGRASPVW